MNRFIKFILVLSANYFCLISASGQTAIPSTGGTATGSGGTVTYTAGQVSYITITGSSASVAQGVQQPWEISVVTAIEKTEGITLGMKVYPNPADEMIFIDAPFLDGDVYIYNSIGQLVQSNHINNVNRSIAVDELVAGNYFIFCTTNKETGWGNFIIK